MKTALYDRHLALGAKMISFADWEMPVHYQGTLAEHQAVRQKVGLFDVSHMGRIKVSGPDAESLLDFLSTNQIAGKAPGLAIYTVWCREDGGSVDDVIVYKEDECHFFVITNAANRHKDLSHLEMQARLNAYEVEIEEVFQHSGIISLQGPSALPLLVSLVPEVEFLKPMRFLSSNDKESLIISRTGYTGAGGFEFYGSADQIADWWDILLDKGQTYGIQPAGLGARDTLRLELGFALYGHELSDIIAPNESVAAWTVKWDKSQFLGKEALLKIKQSPTKRWPYGIRLLERGIARQGCPVLKEGIIIGEVTSGSFSPTLGEGIALILVDSPLKIGEEITLQIRQTLCHAQVVEIPFVRKIA
jgi:aminomethyltransferase